ncbi:hypothetical protein OIO90_002315 [Microbotryomycetes sp. JL221]|nr:hypothetical protein OIO90_002315 [Microbotryomycetes sp. JL221]
MLIQLASAVFLAAVTTAAPLEKRATTLANGYGMKSGKISNQLSWQSSGKLISGGCPYGTGISSCYQVLLGSSGNLARRSEQQVVESDSFGANDIYMAEASPFKSALDDDSPEWEDMRSDIDLTTSKGETPETATALVRRASARQRIELYSLPMAGAGSSWTFQWKSYLSGSGFKASSSWNHLFQLLSRGGSRSGPIITLDVRNGKAFIADPARCKECTSIPISSFTGRTIKHTLTVKFGSSGRLLYTASNAATGQRLLSYSFSGNTGSEASLKAGAYREVSSDMTALKAYVGDFSFHRNA